jgi:hypothetical protein
MPQNEKMDTHAICQKEFARQTAQHTKRVPIDHGFKGQYDEGAPLVTISGDNIGAFLVIPEDQLKNPFN